MTTAGNCAVGAIVLDDLTHARWNFLIFCPNGKRGGGNQVMHIKSQPASVINLQLVKLH